MVRQGRRAGGDAGIRYYHAPFTSQERPLVPTIVRTLRGYRREQFAADLVSGLIVGIVAIPLAIAFAIASGVTPDRGLATAIVAGFLISALGGSRVLIGGPTGAFVVIVYGIVQQHGLEGLLLATMMAGLLLVMFGLARLGTVIKYIPYPVTLGFTSGIGLVIFAGEVKDFLGLEMGSLPPGFIGRWGAYAAAIGTVNWWALGVGLFALAILVWWPRVSRGVPSPFVALVASTLVVYLAGLPVETIGDRFGHLGGGLPLPRLPHVDLALVPALIGPALTIAVLAAVESLLAAVVADGMIGDRHDSNMELIGQGIANLVTPLFGGIPATGAIARTATNVRAGGRTPVAGIVHSVMLLFVALFIGGLVERIPLATLAAILMVVAWHMGEWGVFRAELKGPGSDVAVLLTTFALTVLVDLTVAIEVGMVLAAFLFMRRMSEVASVSLVSTDEAGQGTIPDLPKAVAVYEIDGPFFFGAAETFRETMHELAERPRILVLRLRHVPVIDSTGLHALHDLVLRCRADGTRVILSGLTPRLRGIIERSALGTQLEPAQLFGDFEEALEEARRRV